MNWEIFPRGLYDLLLSVTEEYDRPKIYITENGAAFKDEVCRDGVVIDEERVDYLKEHFSAAHRALEDGVRLAGYYVWSLMDNFEWSHGYSKRFGLIGVDYNTQERFWKKSAQWYREVIRNNGL
jgi:beta-glucosidase